MAYIKYSYLGSTAQSQANIMSDIATILSGQTTIANLTGKIIISSAAVGITNASTTVTWTGADDGSVLTARRTLEVGQGVSGVGIPAGTTVATITNQTGFTLSAAATATNAAAILILDDTANLPCYTIGSTTKAVSSATSTTLTLTGMCTSTLGIMAVGQSVAGIGIPTGTVVSTLATANTITISNAATSTVSGLTLVIAPGSGTAPTVCCDTANTTIGTSYYAAGWTIWDSYANGGLPNVIAVRAPLADDSTQFKILTIDCSTAGNLSINNPESINNSTHALTNNPAIFGNTYQQRITPSVAAVMYMFASARCAMFLSVTAAGTGCSANATYTGLFERSRLSPWDTVANAYPISSICGPGVFSTSVLTYAPRIKNQLGVDATLVPLSTMLMGGATDSSGVTIKASDGLGGFYTPFTDWGMYAKSVAYFGGMCGSVCDVWISVAYPQNFDTTTYAGKNYTFWAGSAAEHAVPLG